MITFQEFLENQTRKYLVGNCVNSFDQDGNCLVPQLPYSDTTDFAQAEENATPISRDEFLKFVKLPDNLNNINAVYLHDQKNDIFMLYDQQKDVHHFFA